MEYKNQHFVTESYIKAWRDPKTPNGAFVWTVSKQNKTIRRKSPKSLFSEEDFYTVYDSDGNRILELEHKLRDIEDKFISLRDNKLQTHQALIPEDRQTIALFVSTMFSRTKRQKEESQQLWQEYLEFIDSLPNKFSSQIKRTKEYQDVLDWHSEQPMPFHMFHFVRMTAPYLFLLNCAIFGTNQKQGFITSDNPCFWFDPAVYASPSPPTFFGVGSPTLNVILPISPTQYISLQRNGPDGYFDLSSDPKTEKDLIDNINGLTATNCDNFIVVNQQKLKES